MSPSLSAYAHRTNQGQARSTFLLCILHWFNTYSLAEESQKHLHNSDDHKDNQREEEHPSCDCVSNTRNADNNTPDTLKRRPRKPSRHRAQQSMLQNRGDSRLPVANQTCCERQQDRKHPANQRALDYEDYSFHFNILQT
jgi:hypothetical protein